MKGTAYGFGCFAISTWALVVSAVAADPLTRSPCQGEQDHLSGSQPLEIQGDLASIMVDGIDRFLQKELNESVERRSRLWSRDFDSRQAYEDSIATNRERLKSILGLQDKRPNDIELRTDETITRSAQIATADGFNASRVSWPAFADVTGSGLLLQGNSPQLTVIAIPDCSMTPEQMAGLQTGVPAHSQVARCLAENGCRVLVPKLIDRQEKFQQITNREWVYRSAFEMGRTLIGFEVQKVLALVDWHRQHHPDENIAVFGYGEGGLIALYAAALDTRIDAVGVSGYFTARENLWQEPIDRNLFGLLEAFGDAEIASMIMPRPLIVEASEAPTATLSGGRGAPGKIVSPNLDEVRAEFRRVQHIFEGTDVQPNLKLVVSENGNGPFGTEQALSLLMNAVGAEFESRPQNRNQPSLTGPLDYLQARQENQLNELDRHNQQLLADSHFVRQRDTMGRFELDSLEAYERSAVPVRQDFVITSSAISNARCFHPIPGHADSVKRIIGSPTKSFWTCFPISSLTGCCLCLKAFSRMKPDR